MTIYLLDANVLIALLDPLHTLNRDAKRWFDLNLTNGWATCPLTQNALIRILAHPRYPNGSVTPEVAAALLRTTIDLPGHRFWPDEISLLDPARVDSALLLTSAQIIDAYLLALAVAHSGKLATFDRRLVSDAVIGGAGALYLIPTGNV